MMKLVDAFGAQARETLQRPQKRGRITSLSSQTTTQRLDWLPSLPTWDALGLTQGGGYSCKSFSWKECLPSQASLKGCS